MKRMKYVMVLFVLLCAVSLSAAPKQNLKILYVSGTPDVETLGFVEKVDSLTLAKSVQARSASWTSMLKKYFKTVKTVQGKNYVQSMSNDYDVTIFDGAPKPLREKKRIYNEKGQIIQVINAAYLTDDFDRPAITIAEMGEEIGRSLGLKSDWYCLCLEEDALGWKAEHPIFKGPFSVKLKTFEAPTPDMAKSIAKMFGQQLPEKTLMFRVQAQEYTNDSKLRIGMVSRPDGFGDPDDEVISSGKCGKSIDAVALGRHANFLHWGWAVSPDIMTPEAQQIFANAVVYISKFAGQRPIARKMEEQIQTRHWLGAKNYSFSRKAWEENRKSNQEFNLYVDSIKTVAKAKKANGEALSEYEKVYIDFKLQPLTTYDQYLRQREPELYALFGTCTDLYEKYYEINIPYFYAESYNLKIDEDARELGIANNDKRLLDSCITMLEKNEDAERARRILEHYTLCRFDTPKEWRDWFDAYKDKLFFSEGGGYLWLVNTQDRTVPGNDYSILETDEETPAPVISGQTTPKNPVLIEGKLNDMEDGDKELVVSVKIHPGFHLYAHVSDKDPFIEAKLDIQLPEGVKKIGDMKLPAMLPLGESGTLVYDGNCIFRQRLSGNGAGKMRCIVSYQCCDNTICLQPAEKTLEFEY